MQILITIKCDNAAFDENPGKEVARIMGILGNSFINYDYNIKEVDGKKLHDSNGNSCGKVEIKE